MSLNSSGRNSPNLTGSKESLTLQVPPATSKTQTTIDDEPLATRTRSKSPDRLSPELTIKYQSQLNRINNIEEIISLAPDDVAVAELSDVNEDLEQLETFHQEFIAVHSLFEMQWPAKFLDHSYFADNLHQKEARLYRKAKLTLGKLKHKLTGSLQVVTTQSTQESRFESKLPDISLPTFSGDYSDWPAFREMFSCLILDNVRLSNVERLHYLRSCMEGPPAHLISSFPLVGTSLQPSWELLTERFENKRLLIQAQLDKLCHLTPLTSKSAKGLTALITCVAEANKALESLGVNDLGDHMLTYHVSRHLDRTTREAWETSLGSSTEYPRFTQLEKFVNSRARALERIEVAPATTQQTSTTHKTTHLSRKTASAHQATASDNTQQREKQQSSQFYCDCCDGNHFVVVCPKFRELDVPARRKLAEVKRLCYNCLGRHSAHSCKSTKGCKHCSSRHHTMLHSNNPRSTQQGNSRAIEPAQSTSSAPH